MTTKRRMDWSEDWQDAQPVKQQRTGSTQLFAGQHFVHRANLYDSKVVRVPTKPRSCVRARNAAAGAADAADAADAAAAELLLHITAAPLAPSAVPAVPAKSASPCPRAGVPAERPCQAPPPANMALGEAAAPLPHLRCLHCRQPAVLRGEKRPTFFCASCPSKNGSQKRTQTAWLGERLVSVGEAAELLRQRGGAPAAEMVLEGWEGPQRAAQAVTAPEPDTVRMGLAPPAATSSTEEADEPQHMRRTLNACKDGILGRCKCGKRISGAHPPCKSELMLLCERFLARFGCTGSGGRPRDFMLNDVADALAVPRRRLYDIINVFEAMEVVVRTGKLKYRWHGMGQLPGLLARLGPASACDVMGGMGGEPGGKVPAPHSLWMLSRKFVQLLLSLQAPVTLADAAAALIGAGCTADKRAQAQITVERRLYDIGSILSSAHLIQRTYLAKRQPAFSWNRLWRPLPGDRAGGGDAAELPATPCGQPASRAPALSLQPSSEDGSLPSAGSRPPTPSASESRASQAPVGARGVPAAGLGWPSAPPGAPGAPSDTVRTAGSASRAARDAQPVTGLPFAGLPGTDPSCVVATRPHPEAWVAASKAWASQRAALPASSLPLPAGPPLGCLRGMLFLGQQASGIPLPAYNAGSFMAYSRIGNLQP